MRRLFLLLPLVAACSLGPELVPDNGAERAPGSRTAAFTETHGVRITIDGSAWQSDPIGITDALTPVLVTIENRSDFPLRLSYRDFALVGSTGFRYSALPPLQMKGQLPVSRSEARPPGVRLAVSGVAPSFSAWPYLYPYDLGYYDEFSGYWPEQMPTRDMINAALPEGVVEAGGSISGYLYFQKVAPRETRVQFEMKLIDARGDKPVSDAAIPLVVTSSS